MLLSAFSVLLILGADIEVSAGLAATFAGYGALHAMSVVLALPPPAPLRRSGLFIVLAAFLSVIALRVGIVGMQLTRASPGSVTLYLVLGLSAFLGAVMYGLSIRILKLRAPSARQLAAISSGCMLSSAGAYFMVSHRHALGPWWLAILWWYAFSIGLRYSDRRRTAARPRV